MSRTYLHTNGNINISDGEVCISSCKLVADNCGCSGDPCVIPVGLGNSKVCVADVRLLNKVVIK